MTFNRGDKIVIQNDCPCVDCSSPCRGLTGVIANMYTDSEFPFSIKFDKALKNGSTHCTVKLEWFTLLKVKELL
jgi:hypothetical protein